MKTIRKVTAGGLALAFALVGANSLVNSEVTYAAKETKKEVLDLGVSQIGGEYKEKTVNINPNNIRYEQFLMDVADVRASMWDQNILYTLDDTNEEGTSIRDVAKANGYPTRDAYVNGLTWSNDLERIAIQRSFEQTFTGLGSQRPDGSSFETATINGNKSDMELLSSNKIDPIVREAVGQWSFGNLEKLNNKSVLDYLKKAKGVRGELNSNLHDLLNPTYKYAAYAEIEEIEHGTTFVSAEFAKDIKNNSDKLSDIRGGHILSIGKKSTKDKGLSEEEKSDIRQAINKAKTEIKAAEDLIENYPKTVSRVKDKLTKIIGESKDLIKELETILNK